MLIEEFRLKAGILAGVGLVGALGASCALAAQSPQVPLNAGSIPQWVNQLPLLSLPTGAGASTDPGTIPALVAGPDTLNISVCEFESSILPPGTPLAAGADGKTWTWGYTWTSSSQACNPRDIYLGPVVVAIQGTPTTINFVNSLGTVNTGTSTDTNVTFYKYSIDQTLHWGDPLGTNPAGGSPLGPEANACAHADGIPGFGSPCAQNYAGPIPAVPHLHGGEVPPVLDGGPDAWWTNNISPYGVVKGHAYYTKAGGGAAANAAIYTYPNSQSGAPIWFHDHLLGATRLNVYAGIAGAYLITEAGTLPSNLPGPAEIIPVVLQDRMFDTNGQLFFPGDSVGGVLWSVNPEHPYWVPEFIGNTIVVNGKAWPNLTVDAKRYRFWFVNGSNARTYVMTFSNKQPIYVIADDGGYLDNAVPVTTLTMMPGERYEAIIDFAGLQSSTLLLKNSGKAPFPGGAQPAASTVGRLLQVTVNACGKKGQPACPTDTSYNPATTPQVRQQPMVRLTNPVTGTLAPGVVPANTRQLTLNEVLAPKTTVTDPVTGVLTNYPGGPLEILVNNTKWDGLSTNGQPVPGSTTVTIGTVSTSYTEVMQEGTTEVWEIINTTADAHPMHTHLTDFQILNRQPYNVKNYLAAYNATFPGSIYLPAYGPPGDYNTANARGAIGGNPDVTPYLSGAAVPPAPEESGWKDTVMAPPGQVTRIVVRFSPNSAPVVAPTSGPTMSDPYPFDPNAPVNPNDSSTTNGYVWHCHIVDHEDNEMMRPDLVNALSGTTRTYIQCNGTNGATCSY